MLVAIVLAMVALPTLEAVVRRLTGSGVPGAAVYTEHFTLWVGFLGALLATATGHHLALSTVDLLPEGLPRILARGVGAAVTSRVCAVLAYASIDMILADKDRVDTLPFKLVPAWFFRWIVPLILLGLAAWQVRRMLREKRLTLLAGALVLVACAGFSRWIAAATLSTPPGGPPERRAGATMPGRLAAVPSRRAPAA